MHKSIEKIFEKFNKKIFVYNTNGNSIFDDTKLSLDILNSINENICIINDVKFLRGKSFIYSCEKNESDMVLRLCDMLVEQYNTHANTQSLETVLLKIFEGNVQYTQSLQSYSLHDARYAIIYVVGVNGLYGDIQELYPSDLDILIDIHGVDLAIIHYIDGLDEYDDVKEFAYALLDTIEQELGKSLVCSVSDTKSDYNKLYEAYNEAKKSLSILKKLSYKQKCVFYNELLLERILLDIHPQKRKEYYEKLFTPAKIKKLNSELINTIEVFLQNNLNPSETAKHLYIHTNTLAYRLKKINKIFNIDIKQFNDASIFKMLLIMKKLDEHLGE